jgi:hypothetical protein
MMILTRQRQDPDEVCSEDTCTEFYASRYLKKIEVSYLTMRLQIPIMKVLIQLSMILVGWSMENSGFIPQNVDAVYSTQVDNYNCTDAVSVLVDDTDSGKLLILSDLALL